MIDRSNAKRIAYIQVKNEIETNIRNMEAGARAFKNLLKNQAIWMVFTTIDSILRLGVVLWLNSNLL